MVNLNVFRKQERRNYFQELGFSFIELLVVVGMVGLATGIGVAAYNNFNDQQKVEQAAKELASNLRFLQSNAISGIKSFGTESCGANENLDGWYADITNNKYYLMCSNGDEIPASDDRLPLVEGADISSSPGLVRFNPVYGDTDLRDTDLSDVLLPITVTISGKEKTVNVFPNGNVSIE